MGGRLLLEDAPFADARPHPASGRRDAIIAGYGEMAERLNAAVLKTVERESVPGVRIPLSPPLLVTHRRHGPLEQRIDHVGDFGSAL